MAMPGQVSDIRDYRRRRSSLRPPRNRPPGKHRFRKPPSRLFANLVITLLACVAIALLGVAVLGPSQSNRTELLSPAQTFVVPASTVKVIDGDTISIGPERFRLDRWDTPEKFGQEKCTREKRLGEQASRAARKVFRDAQSVTIVRNGTDAYGRTVSRWVIDGHDYGGLLHRQGLAKPWAHGRQAKPDWCGTA